MHCILLGIERNNDGQRDLPSPRKTHKTPGLDAGEGALKTQSPGEELEKGKSGDSGVELQKPKEVSVSKERIIP